MRRLFFVLLLGFTTCANAQTWLHVYGRSWHDRSGFREINTGVGLEQKFNHDWSWSLGTFQNSIDRQSATVLAKYHWFTDRNWSINLQMGAVTGYRHYPVAPVILPEVCWSWLCGMVIPPVANKTVAAGAVYLRIPINK